MTAYEYIVRMKDRASQAISNVAKAAGVGENRLLGFINKSDRAERSTSRWSFSLGKLNGLLGAFGVALGIGALVSFNNQLQAATANFEALVNTMEFASGQNFEKNKVFLDKRIKDLSLDMKAAYDGYSQLAGSLRGTSIEKDINSVFDGVSTAAATLNLSKDQIKGAYLAIGQMASKGKVQAEELRGQLGERIPGAFKIAADAMGVTQARLNEMLDNGEIMADVFLPRFAKQLKETFAPGLEKSVNSLQASINRKNNAIQGTVLWLGEKLRPMYIWWNDFVAGTLMPKLQSFANMVVTNWGAIKAYGLEVWDMLKGVGMAFWDLIQVVFMFDAKAITTKSALDAFSTAFNYLKIALDVVTSGLRIFINSLKPYAPLIRQIVFAYGVFTAAQWLLNAAMAANPLGLIVGAFIALVGIIAVAYKRVGWFRGAIDAAWETIKGFAVAIKDYVVNRILDMVKGITGLGSTLRAFFRGDWQKAWELGKQAVKDLTGINAKEQFVKDMYDTGKRAAAAYKNGVDSVRKGEMREQFKNRAAAGAAGWAAINKYRNQADGNTEGFDPTGGDQSTKGLQGITGGGSKQVNISVHLQKLQDKTEVHVTELKEGIAEAEEKLKEMLLRVLNSANQMQTT